MNTVVEPYVSPAGSVIDWTDLGQRIGDRDPSDPSHRTPSAASAKGSSSSAASSH
ncbi:hypothetical protein ACFQZ4_54075 [Catellatospora coxensis]